MRLHELYFGNMSKEGGALSADSALVKKIVEDFGSVEKWESDFRATGAMRGIGWVILVHDTMSGKLFNTWVNEHDAGHLAGTKPILLMDVFEHAFMIDYGLKRADYLVAFWKSIDWKELEKRFEK
jgi:Fe-Mn family superoxide dismutase